MGLVFFFPVQVAVFFHSAVAVWVFGDAQITGTKNFLFDSSEASSYVAEVSKILGNQATRTRGLCCRFFFPGGPPEPSITWLEGSKPFESSVPQKRIHFLRFFMENSEFNEWKCMAGRVSILF